VEKKIQERKKKARCEMIYVLFLLLVSLLPMYYLTKPLPERFDHLITHTLSAFVFGMGILYDYPLIAIFYMIVILSSTPHKKEFFVVTSCHLLWTILLLSKMANQNGLSEGG